MRVLATLLAVLSLLATTPPVHAGAAPAPTRRLRSSDPEERLAALRELGALPPSELRSRSRSLRGVLRRLLARDRLPAVRAAAAPVLARMDGEEAIEALTDAVERERDAAVAAALVAAWAQVPAEPARRALSRLAFDTQDTRAAALAAEALGAVAAGAGLDDLLALLGAAPRWAVAAGACRGLASHRETRVADALVARLRHPDPAVRCAARAALVAVCGVDRGVEPSAWETWWAESRAGYRFPDAAADAGGGAPRPPPAAAAERATTDGGARDRRTFARFFGIELTGRRIVFVVDFSQSMWGERRDRAQGELIGAVKGLSGEHTFGVILFNEKVWWFGEGPLPARPQQKLDLAAYLPEQETKSYTNIYDAMERALGLLGVGAQAVHPAPGVDEIVLLSDGVPNRGKLKRTDQILEAVGALNAGRARIHTVSLLDEPSELLEELARRNGGRHVQHAVRK